MSSTWLMFQASPSPASGFVTSHAVCRVPHCCQVLAYDPHPLEPADRQTDRQTAELYFLACLLCSASPQQLLTTAGCNFSSPTVPSAKWLLGAPFPGVRFLLEGRRSLAGPFASVLMSLWLPFPGQVAVLGIRRCSARLMGYRLPINSAWS